MLPYTVIIMCGSSYDTFIWAVHNTCSADDGSCFSNNWTFRNSRLRDNTENVASDDGCCLLNSCIDRNLTYYFNYDCSPTARKWAPKIQQI